MTVPREEAPANSVPAAAVIQRVRALSGITGRKGRVGGHHKAAVKVWSSTPDRPRLLEGLSMGEGCRIPGVAVKCVDIWRNTGGEGGILDRH